MSSLFLSLNYPSFFILLIIYIREEGELSFVISTKLQFYLFHIEKNNNFILRNNDNDREKIKNQFF